MKFSLGPKAFEESTFKITVSFLDSDGVAVTPTSATWTLTKKDGTVVNSRSAVSIGAPTSVEVITLQGDDLAILDGKDLEYRVFLVEAVYPGTEPVKGQAWFALENLTKVP